MKLSQSEKEKARKDCHFYYNGYCLNEVKGKTWCICLTEFRNKKKAKEK